MESPTPSPPKIHPPPSGAALRTVLVGRKVPSSSSSSRAQVPRRSFPPDSFTSRTRTPRPSPLGPKGGRKAVAAERSSDEDDWSSDDGGEEEGDGQEQLGASTSSSSDDDDGDLGVVRRAKSRKFAKGVGKVRFFSAGSVARRRERTPSYSPKKETTSGGGGEAGARLAAINTPPGSHHTSPSKSLRANCTPYTPLTSRTLVHHPSSSSTTTSPADSTKLHATRPPSWSPESIASGPFLPSPTSSQSSWSLITPQIPQNEFDTSINDMSIDSIIIIHDAANISEKFVRGNRGTIIDGLPGAATTPLAPPSTPPSSSAIAITAASTPPIALSPFAKPFVSTQTRSQHFERTIDFAEVMSRGGAGGGLGISSMEEKKMSPERQVLMKQILRAVTPSKPTREQVAESMVRRIVKRSEEMGENAEQEGTSIACMVGPESLPYARNPSGVDGSVVGSDGRLNVWTSSAQDPECEHVESFQRRPGASNPILRGNNTTDPAHGLAYCHPSAFRIQPHGRGRVIPQAPQYQTQALSSHLQRLTLAPPSSSSLVSSPLDLHPCPSPSFSDFSFDSRACFPSQPLRFNGPSPPTPFSSAFPPSPLHQHQHYQVLQQQHHIQQQLLLQQQQREQFEQMARQAVHSPRPFSNQELFEVASNILGLGHPSSFGGAGRGGASSGGSTTPSSSLGLGGPDFQRQANQLERILLLSTIATSLRSASDSVVSASPAPVAMTPRSISSPVPATIPLLGDGGVKALGSHPGLSLSPAPVLDEASAKQDGSLDFRASPPSSQGLPSIPLSQLNDPAVVQTKQHQQPAPAFAAEPSPRPRTDAYQVRKDGVPSSLAAPRSRSNTTTTPNHSHHDETFIFLPAGVPPGFANNGARKPGPRAGLPARTMAGRALDAMRKASEREGRGGGKLVEMEREEVLLGQEAEDREKKVEVRVGDLWRRGAGQEDKRKEGKEKKTTGWGTDASATTGAGVLTLGSLSAMFGESSKSNVPLSPLPVAPDKAHQVPLTLTTRPEVDSCVFPELKARLTSASTHLHTSKTTNAPSSPLPPSSSKPDQRFISAISTTSTTLNLGLPKKPEFASATPPLPSTRAARSPTKSPRTSIKPKFPSKRRVITTTATKTSSSSSVRNGK